MTLEARMARAGDYVLGLMDEAERERAERDMAIDPEFRDCVMMLAQRFHVFDRTAEPADLRPDMWQEVAARIKAMPQLSPQQAAAARMAMTGAGSPQEQRHGFLQLKRSSAHSFGGARGVLLAACLFASVGVGYFVGQGTVVAPDPVVVVVLVDGDNAPGAFVEAYGDDSVRVVPLVDFEVPEGKTLELWTLYDQGIGPVSLGTFERSHEIRLRGPMQPMPQPEQLYEISLEDTPGSRTGQPTGPILVKGLAVRPPG